MSLAISDLLVAVTVMPMSAAYVVAERWPFGLFMCQVWMAIDYTASTASILNLFTLSVDRYCSVRSPLKYLHQRTIKRAAVMITATWCLSLTWLLPIALWHHVANNGKRLIPSDVCETEFSTNRTFKILSATINYYLPLTVMIILNVKIFVEIRHRASDFCDRCDKVAMAVPQRETSSSPGLLNESKPPQRKLCKQATIELESLSSLPAQALRDISQGKWSDNPLCHSPATNISLRYRSLQRHIQILDELDEEKMAASNAGIEEGSSGTSEARSDDHNSDIENEIANCYDQLPGSKYANESHDCLKTVESIHRNHSRVSIGNDILASANQCLSVNCLISSSQRSSVKYTISSNHHYTSFSLPPLSVQREPEQSSSSDNQQNAHFSQLETLAAGDCHDQLATSASDNDEIFPEDSVIDPPITANLYNKRRMSVDWTKVVEDINAVRRKINSTFAVKESKAARQLCVIMSVFIVCFFPYFACYIIVSFDQSVISSTMMRVVTWCGYVNSTLNPFLYSLCNVQFRRTFRRFFRLRYQRTLRPIRTNHVINGSKMSAAVRRFPTKSFRKSLRK